MEPLKEQIAALSRELGFEKMGIVELPTALRREYFEQWLAKGNHGEMDWMAKEPHRRSNPSEVLPEANSILCFGLNYYQDEPQRRGRIAKYALGADYHKSLLKKLKTICRLLQENGGINRPYVDTGPLLEKPIAALAGLGWQGKNTILLNPDEGQWLFLGFILTSLILTPDKPIANRCGSCTRCIDICPTQAITAPYQLDSRKCISYLTIEHKGSIPLEYRRLIGNHLYGCDDCLDVCPWNKWARQTREAKFQARDYPDLSEMLDWDEDTFNEIFAGTPIRRLKRPRWIRNVATVLGNIGEIEDLPPLYKLRSDPDPMIVDHVDWAIKEIENRCSIN